MFSVAALLASIALYAPLPANATIHLGQCPTIADPASCAYAATGDIYVRFEPGVTRTDDVMLLAHELGHLWDAQHMDDWHRARFAQVLGKAGEAWVDPTSQRAAYSPGEQFANVYSLCALSHKARRWFLREQGGYAGAYFDGSGITKSVVASTCWLLDHPPIQNGTTT